MAPHRKILKLKMALLQSVESPASLQPSLLNATMLKNKVQKLF